MCAGGAVRGFRETAGGAALLLSASASASFHGVLFDDNSLLEAVGPNANGAIARLRKDSFANFTDCSFTNLTAAVRPPPLLAPPMLISLCA